MTRLWFDIRLMRQFGNGWLQSIVKGFRAWSGERVYVYPAKGAFDRVE